MSNLLVKRVDSAHMKRMFDKALENSDVNFLSSTTNVSLDQVRNLKLDSDSKESTTRKVQPKPPQPPKQRPPAGFNLNTLDLLLDDADAESWLVASSVEDSASKTRPELVSDSRKELVGSPIESCNSSEIRNSSLTPASVLDVRPRGSKQGLLSESPVFGTSPENYTLARPRSACTSGHVQSTQVPTGNLDIRHRPRSVGCVNHTPAPVMKKKPPRSIGSIIRPKSSMERTKPPEAIFYEEEEEEEKVESRPRSRIPRLGLRSGRLERANSPEATPAASNKSATRSLSSLASKCRPFSKSVGPTKHSKLPPLSPSPVPKSYGGKANKSGSKDGKRTLGGRKLTSSVPPSRPPSALNKDDRKTGKKTVTTNKETKRGL